jgi:hypothetical protein
MAKAVNQSRVLYIIGASGLLGKAISEHFSHPNWMVVSGRARVEGNLSEIKKELAALKLEHPKSRITIINCAWSPKPTGGNRLDPSNLKWIQITKDLVELCLEGDISYYGIGTGLEKDSTIEDPYTEAKRESAKILERARTRVHKEIFSTHGQMSFGWLRLFYVYSLSPLTPALVRFVSSEINNRNSHPGVPISVEIESNNSHDYIELKACVNLIQKVIISESSGEFDLGTGKIASNMSLIERLFPGVSVTTSGHSTILGTSLPADIEWEKKIH